MKKYVISILSLLFFIGSFCSASIYVRSPVINHSWLDYLCYFNWLSVYTWKTFPQYVWSYDYYLIPFSCWSFDTLNSFSPYFKFFTEYSWFITNYYSSSSPSFRFFSKSLNFFPAAPSANVFSSFIKSSLTTSSTRNFISSNYLLKINLDNWEFLSYNPTNIQWFFYDNYFFSGVSLWYNNVVNSFYLPWVAASFVYNSSSWFIFQTIFSDWYSLNDSWKIVNFQSIYDDILTIPLLDFWYNYLTWSKTLLLKFYNNSLVYNILDCFTSKSSVLKSCSVIDKWYFSNYSDFLLNSWFVTYWVDLSVLYSYSGSKNRFSFVYYDSWVLSSFYFSPHFVDIGATWSNSYYHDDYKNLIVSKKSFELTTNSSVLDILSTINFPLTTWEVSSWSIKKCMNDVNYYHLNSLFCNSLGVYIWADWVPVLHTSPSCLRIIQAFNDSWDLVELTVSCDEAQSFLSWWFYQDSSWNIFYKCFWDTCLYTNVSQYFQSWIVSDSYYNSDSVFFSCPYPIITWSNNILSRFSNLQLWQYSIWLPILCFYSSFLAWKNYKLFSWFDSWLSQPLFWYITSSTDDRVYLFKFLDIILWLGIMFFLLKLYHLTK